MALDKEDEMPDTDMQVPHGNQVTSDHCTALLAYVTYQRTVAVEVKHDVSTCLAGAAPTSHPSYHDEDDRMASN